MSVSRSYNRIVFLTTLSVYLGLVLVGGTAPVLAHSALTKHFDVQNEIEFKDELDNKPDNEEIESLMQVDFPELFAQLISEAKEGVRSGKVTSPIQTSFHYEVSFSYSGRCNTSFVSSDISTNNYLREIVANSLGWKFRLKALEIADYPTASRKDVKINLQATATDLSLKISFGKSNAAEFAEFLNRKFSSSAVSEKDELLKQIYKNTQVTSENNQVFIVTHLPRASIDEFLAETDAQ